MVVRRLRPHHGVCIQFFQGKGYDAAFVQHMQTVIGYLDENDPELKLLPGCDTICAHCPHDQGGICQKAQQVRDYDMQVLRHCRLDSGCTVRWSDFSSRIRRDILDAGKRSEICKDCMWNSICEVQK